ncbi:putative elongator complex protein 4 [Scaptodrosophila lebanonensis]|uniref:Elongator complex protein 4 n=1 Tax=Drosophila lebanonensis TaxID=7225 RepID=A0A6J2TYK1_DROLE|nr:putative elongator complex protein 4 [Scaptodrosophila lebanonensis]
MTSFRKRTKPITIRGTRTSPHTAQVITSSGNPSLDMILGGGLQIGSICLIEEDRFMTHAKVLAKYFLAEGVLSKQDIFLGSLDDIPAEMLRRLPKPLTDEEAEVEQLQQQQEQQAIDQQADKNGLRIAWRYSDLPLVNSEQASAKIGHHFNLMEHMDTMQLYYAQTTVWDDSDKEPDIVIQEECSKSSSSSVSLEREQPAAIEPMPEGDVMSIGAGDNTTANNNNINAANMDNSNTANIYNNTTTTTPASNCSPASSTQPPHIFYNQRYGRLFNEMQQLLHEKRFMPGTNTQQKNLCRVCLTSLGSPLWYDDHFGEDMLKFLTVLRASIRSCTSVCFITMPMHLIAKYDSTLVAKIRQLVDYAIELESFAGSERETHPAYKEYSGLLHLHKMTALNTLAAHMPETTDLAFKLRRKKFVIEKLHLPPELQETPTNSTMTSSVSLPKCAAGTELSINSNASLDF